MLQKQNLQTTAVANSKLQCTQLLSLVLFQYSDVIDVSSIEPHSIERTEYMERSRQYM